MYATVRKAMGEPDRVPLCLLPTPMHPLPRLSDELGIDLWIKRDDLNGFAFGGNKGRKLEYLMADVLARKAQVVVSCGATQSNHIRQLGAACARFGLRCEAVVMDLPYDAPSGRPLRAPRAEGGNVVLDEILGVKLHKIASGNWERLESETEKLASSLEDAGARVAQIALGGSSALGAYAFWRAAGEVGTDFDFLVTASSSGSTQCGLTYAYRGSKTRVLGIACDPEPQFADDVAELGRGLADLLGTNSMGAREFDVRHGWVGEGYGVGSEAGEAAIQKMARSEGVFLDPIYTGKAAAGLFELARTGEIWGKVLFWHTGGTPALFARETS